MGCRKTSYVGCAPKTQVASASNIVPKTIMVRQSDSLIAAKFSASVPRHDSDSHGCGAALGRRARRHTRHCRYHRRTCPAVDAARCGAMASRRPAQAQSSPAGGLGARRCRTPTTADRGGGNGDRRDDCCASPSPAVSIPMKTLFLLLARQPPRRPGSR